MAEVPRFGCGQTPSHLGLQSVVLAKQVRPLRREAPKEQGLLSHTAESHVSIDPRVHDRSFSAQLLGYVARVDTPGKDITRIQQVGCLQI